MFRHSPQGQRNQARRGCMPASVSRITLRLESVGAWRHRDAHTRHLAPIGCLSRSASLVVPTRHQKSQSLGKFALLRWTNPAWKRRGWNFLRRHEQLSKRRAKVLAGRIGELFFRHKKLERVAVMQLMKRIGALIFHIPRPRK
jgi:hypothetical protein